MALPHPGDHGCPNDGVLAAFLHSELSSAESEGYRAHVAVCSTCDSRIRSSVPNSTPAGPTPETGEFHSDYRKDSRVSGLSLLESAKPQAPAVLPRSGSTNSFNKSEKAAWASSTRRSTSASSGAWP